MKLTVKDIVGIMVLGSCVNFLITTEASIWFGGTHIESPFLLAPITRHLAQLLAPSGAGQGAAWQRLYAGAFSLHYIVYATAFWVGNVSARKITPFQQKLLWSVQLLCCLVGFSLLFQLLISELAFRLPLRKAIMAFLVLCCLNASVFICYRFGWMGMPIPPHPGYLWLTVLNAISGLSCFFGIGYLAAVANRSRNAMAAAHAELLATQQLLTEAVRSSERLRIARDLHDTIGHSLTALNLHLELATRQASDVAPASVKIARELAEELLANVRITVNNERRDQGIDLRQALKTLCLGIPEPRIILSIDPDFSIDMPHVAHTLFCCVQEGITNAVRHAGANAINIALSSDGGTVSLIIRDDGRGLDKHAEGNGLRGIRERVEASEGTLEITSPAEGGCVIRIHIPLTEIYS